MRHEPFRIDGPGCVDLWPLTREAPGEERDAWQAPVDAEAEKSANRRLAAAIAGEIAALLARGDEVHDKESGKRRAAHLGGGRMHGDPLVGREEDDAGSRGHVRRDDARDLAGARLVHAVALGHHASERFSMPVLGERLAARVAGIECLSSEADTDPFTCLGDAGGP